MADAMFTVPKDIDPVVGVDVTKVELYPKARTLRVEIVEIRQSGAAGQMQTLAVTDSERYMTILKAICQPDALTLLIRNLAEAGDLPAVTAGNGAPLAPAGITAEMSGK